jgi:hypothetical protein
VSLLLALLSKVYRVLIPRESTTAKYYVLVANKFS